MPTRHAKLAHLFQRSLVSLTKPEPHHERIDIREFLLNLRTRIAVPVLHSDRYDHGYSRDRFLFSDKCTFVDVSMNDRGDQVMARIQKLAGVGGGSGGSSVKLEGAELLIGTRFSHIGLFRRDMRVFDYESTVRGNVESSGSEVDSSLVLCCGLEAAEVKVAVLEQRGVESGEGSKESRFIIEWIRERESALVCFDGGRWSMEVIGEKQERHLFCFMMIC
eukprot:GABV01009186.1.p1 GENE.GABV01009186.1~~GABV01009186.1.p1  ORF type:complete len:220 (+),score=31.76 GABV01009186.1:82-741(+)